jgi:luciferase family oxidoreductase group 1
VLLAYLEDRMPANHPFARLAKTLPGGDQRPQTWLLGSSPQSAIWAAELGMPYAFADFINPEGDEITSLYRERFAAAGHGHEPRTAVGVWVICADSDGDARTIAASGRMTFTLLRRGELIAVPPPERALRFLEQQRSSGNGRSGGRRRGVVGTPASVREELEGLADRYGAEEVIAVNVTYSHEARRRSYELLAEAFALEGTAIG